MAGRYQGYHCVRTENGEKNFEIFWQQTGWFWRPRTFEGEAKGPFTTSTEAYQNACSDRLLARTSKGSGGILKEFFKRG